MKNKKKKYFLLSLIFLIVINLALFSFYKVKVNKKKPNIHRKNY